MGLRKYSAAVGFANLLAMGTLGAQPALPTLPSFDGRPLTLSASAVAALGRGDPVVELLESKDPRVVAVFGIIAVNVARTFFVSRFTDFPQALRLSGRAQFGVFSTPALLTDAGSVGVSHADIAALRACRPGSCAFKLPSSEMTQLRAIIDNAGAGAPAEIARYARKRAAEYVNAYREHGDAAMVVYDDFGRAPVHASDAFAALLSNTTYLTQNAPLLEQSLTGSPRRRIDGAAEAIYWARDETMGMRPTLSVTQITVYSPPEKPLITVGVTKQLFADHYFESAFDLFVAVSRTDIPRGEGMYLMVLRQDRFDHVPSGGLLNVRARVIRWLHDRTDAELRLLRSDYHAAWNRRR